DKNIQFHTFIGWSIYFFSWLHTVCHWNNLARLSAAHNLGVKGFFLANFATGPGVTGYVMLIALNAMVFTAMKKPKAANYERFWYTHHLFFVFFFGWSLHGTFCMLKPSRPPFCAGTGAFWKYWLVGGFMYIGERLYREIRGSHRTYISKVIQHPSNVCEIQIRKENCSPKAGQYYHPFTLTSASDEGYISIHVRCIGDFTNALARKIGCDFDRIDVKDRHKSLVVGIDNDEKDLGSAFQRVLPRIMIDGPFGSSSEDVFKYEVALLVGAGIGNPFRQYLEEYLISTFVLGNSNLITYRINNATKYRKVRLSKVYFFWICRDFESFEWFRSLLMAIETQGMFNCVGSGIIYNTDISHLIEIHTYFTTTVRPDDATNIMLNDAETERDPITGLKSPTNYGRPDWDRIFRSICTLNPATVHPFGEPKLSFRMLGYSIVVLEISAVLCMGWQTHGANLEMVARLIPQGKENF
ncbi:Cytochrome b-245 heavy chain, partial [Neolecta irregularis DAH-3]